MSSTLPRNRTGSELVGPGRIGLLGSMLMLAFATPIAAQTVAWTTQILRPPGMPESAGTPVAPPAPGQGAPAYAYFGTALTFVDGRLWIGSPGHQHDGVRSGAVWIRALPGTNDASLADPILPDSPVDGLGYGTRIAADAYGPHAAVLARPVDTSTMPVRVSVHSTQTPYTGARPITLPAAGNVTDAGLTIDRSIVAVAWRATIAGSLHAQAFVYQSEASYPLFDLVQTIEMPTSIDSFNIVNGRYVELAEEVDTFRSWLVSGRRVYSRAYAGEPFVYSHELGLPATGVGGSDVTLARHRDRLLLNLNLDQSYLGFFYELDDGGWRHGNTGAIAQGHAIDDACKSIAFDDDSLVCLRVDAEGPYLLVAEKTTWSPPPFWGRIIGSVRVPIPASGLGSPSAIAVSGPHVAIGWPRTGDEDGIPDAGMVVIMTLTGRIFASGFE